MALVEECLPQTWPLLVHITHTDLTEEQFQCPLCGIQFPSSFVGMLSGFGEGIMLAGRIQERIKREKDNLVLELVR